MRSLLFLTLLAGCGGDTLARAEMSDLRKKLDETQKRAAAAERKAEDLQDQVFLLTDKLESQKIASAHPVAPRLPVVLLKPKTSEATDENGEEIVFEGAARSSDPQHARPQLTLSGTQTPTPTPTKPTQARTPAPTSEDKLGVAPAPPIAAATRSDDPVKLYKNAYELLRVGKHDEAARSFREMVRRFPEHELADNALYWLGECFYARKQYTEAMPEFRQVVTRYPLGNKAPDALLKLAYCLLALGDLQKGRDLLKQVPESYPHTEAARLAEIRLSELRSTGGTQ